MSLAVRADIPKKTKNVLRFTPPGFTYSIDVPFPGRCLPVCARCKKNYKTRDHCRTRDCHTDPPWSETFTCITLDANCTDADGKLLEVPFMARPIPDQPYCLRGGIDPTTSICAPCKVKNYTRTYCRTNKQHKQLPWSTVYVILSPARPGNTSSNVKGDATKKVDKKTSVCDAAIVRSAKRHKIEEIGSSTESRGQEDSEEKDVMDRNSSYYIDDLAISKTFVAIVSAETCKIHWLDLDPIIHPTISQVSREQISADTTIMHSNARFPPSEHSLDIRNNPRERPFRAEQGSCSQVGPSTYVCDGTTQAPYQLNRISYGGGVTDFSSSTIAQNEQQGSSSSHYQASAEAHRTHHPFSQFIGQKFHHQLFQSQVSFDNQCAINNRLQLELYSFVRSHQQMLQSQIALNALQQSLLMSKSAEPTQQEMLQLQQTQLLHLQSQQLQSHLLQSQQDTSIEHIGLNLWAGTDSLQQPGGNEFQGNISFHSNPGGSQAGFDYAEQSHPSYPDDLSQFGRRSGN